MRRVAALMLALAAPVVLSATAAPAPRRIVSLNPCVDAILYHIADPERIAAISSYSQDPAATSVPLDWARHFRGLYGTAEEVLVLKPDLVIVTRHTALATRTALQGRGAKLLLFDVPASVDDSREQITAIAAAIGNPAGGARLNAAIAAALRASAPSPGSRPVPALIYLGSGLVPGSGTLADELLRRTGFANQSVAYGLRTWDVLGIEQLLAHPPRVIFTPIEHPTRDGSFEASSRALKAGALDHLRGRTLIADYPETLLHCAGPSIARAVTTLAAARRAVRP